jgi:hypothetical protein
MRSSNPRTHGIGRTVVGHAAAAAEAAARPSRRGRRAPAADQALTRFVNPCMRAVLCSPLHDLMSDRVLLVGFTGRLSGRWRSVPASYLEDAGTLTLLSRVRRRWWRNLRGGAPVRVLLRGSERAGWAEAGRASREEAADVLMRLYSRAGHPIAPARAAELAEDRVVIRLRLDPAGPAARPLRGRALWRRWTSAVAIGETIAFIAPAVAGAALGALDAPFWLLAPVVLACGAVEGAVLGLAQAFALRQALPTVATRDWVRATVVGALVAWSIGLLPSAFELERLPTAAVVGAGVPLATTLLLSMGALQWRVLRTRVPRAGWWIATTAGAWAAGLIAFTAVTSPLWQEGQSPVLIAAIGVLGGVVMATTVAAASGAALVWLTGAERPAPG